MVLQSFVICCHDITDTIALHNQSRPVLRHHAPLYPQGFACSAVRIPSMTLACLQLLNVSTTMPVPLHAAHPCGPCSTMQGHHISYSTVIYLNTGREGSVCREHRETPCMTPAMHDTHRTHYHACTHHAGASNKHDITNMWMTWDELK